MANAEDRFFLVQTNQIGKNVPNDHKLYQTAITFSKWPLNIPHGHKIYQHFPFQCSPKFTQIGIFGLKLNHLATLLQERVKDYHSYNRTRSRLEKVFTSQLLLLITQQKNLEETFGFSREHLYSTGSFRLIQLSAICSTTFNRFKIIVNSSTDTCFLNM
jgi:hypothetical protein